MRSQRATPQLQLGFNHERISNILLILPYGQYLRSYVSSSVICFVYLDHMTSRTFYPNWLLVFTGELVYCRQRGCNAINHGSTRCGEAFWIWQS